MKTEVELRTIIEEIACDKSPVGMNAVYVHALIIDKLIQIEDRFTRLEESRRTTDSATPN